MRNYLIFEKIIIHSGLGYNLWQGNNPNSKVEGSEFENIIIQNLIDEIPKDKFYHITHLIKDAKNQGKKIGVFPVDDDDWIDIGQWAEYQKAIDKF